MYDLLRKTFWMVIFVLPVCAVADDSEDELERALREADIVKEKQERPPVKVKAGESAVIVKRTVTTIKTNADGSITTITKHPDGSVTSVTEASKDGGAVPESNSATKAAIEKELTPSWRCQHFADDAFSMLGSSRGVTRDFETHAAEFIVVYGAKCPSFVALEKELPPWLQARKHVLMLQTLFELNKIDQMAALLRMARGEEIEAHEAALAAKKNPSSEYMEKFREKHREYIRRAAGAKALMALKFQDEFRRRAEASKVVTKFMDDYLGPNGMIKTENIPALKKYISSFNAQQKSMIRMYLMEVIQRREFPKSTISLTATDRKGRAPASVSFRESTLRGAIQVMMFALE